MLRGGSWNNNGRNCRSADRNRNPPDNRNNNIGFRLARARGVPEGPFVFIPILGPNTLLDAVTIPIDLASDLLYHYDNSSVRDRLYVLRAIDVRARLLTAETLLATAAAADLSIAELVLSNEQFWRGTEEVDQRIAAIAQAMRDCIERGLNSDGVLPGKMAVHRRAPKLYRSLSSRGEPSAFDALEWVNAFAIAVNEENAAGGRVVTSPTNGAAGIIPAVMMFYERFVPDADEPGVRRYLLTAGAIGILYKVNASISGAEMGCQGEVGVACSMAAGGLAAALGGSNDHVEEAAEIGMEHNLGLTCDPIGGLVQIPCIERNAMGAVKAINAAKLAMHGDGTHKVTLDQVIETMRQTGLDMSSQYKETSQGGLAVNVPEC